MQRSSTNVGLADLNTVFYGSLFLSSNMGFRFHSVALNDSNDVADDGFDGKQMWEIIKMKKKPT